MKGKKPTKKLTTDEWDEAVLRGARAARDGLSIYANPYDKRRPDLWSVWRLAFEDAAPQPGAQPAEPVTPEQIQRAYRQAYDALIALGATPAWKSAE